MTPPSVPLSHQAEIIKLADAVSAFSATSGERISILVEKNALLLLHWLDYLEKYCLTQSADCLLLSAKSSLREVDACLALGLMRPSILALRCEIDLILSWLYFKDHAVEWEHVNATGNGFKLKTELITYIGTHYQKFGKRWGILSQIKKRKEEDPYKLLSAHIHLQSEHVLPALGELHELVKNADQCIDCAAAVYEVAEYLNDILICVYADAWHALPQPLKTSIEERFITPAQRKEFFV
ncbi:hypothetical protein [Acidovorax sp. ST3]|uniref:hypothetical protein n=1 Tax=Acidovorax sp. ST3 TaxID=2219062 RepID=UPI00129007C9|nr:hypothetical protein [Acidovorax sp. ST3]